MIIHFRHPTGFFLVDADRVILDMPMQKYNKWVKLLNMYASVEDRREFGLLLKAYLDSCYAERMPYQEEQEYWESCASGGRATFLTQKACMEYARKAQRKIKSIDNDAKRYTRMLDKLDCGKTRKEN